MDIQVTAAWDFQTLAGLQMIEIRRKEDCVGCNACVQRCPKGCISMREDGQGFLYPEVNVVECINCGLCERVCPVINREEPGKPDGVYAAWNKDDGVRMSSSSGGVFHALASKVIEDGGVVFGAGFNGSWEAVHSSTETLGGISAFQGSKYVQSRIGDTYSEAGRFLREGRKVLFSGTPCQIAGLRRFLGKDYGERLVTVDVVCHGVPSPGIWKDYLSATADEEGVALEDIAGISFRDKRESWGDYGLAIRFRAGDREKERYSPMRCNPFMQGFLKDLYLRPSCYSCPAKGGRSHSDITLADFWGIRRHHPGLYSDKGVSLVLANTAQGSGMLGTIEVDRHAVSYEEAISGNPSVIRSAGKPAQYDKFWNEYGRHGLQALPPVLKSMRPTLQHRIKRRIKTAIKHIIGKKTVDRIKSHL